MSDLVQVKDRAIVCRICKPLPVEVIVRGYLVGSGRKEYQGSGRVCEIPLPGGLELASSASTPIHADDQGREGRAR